MNPTPTRSAGAAPHAQVVLDHVGFIVEDLDASADLMAQLGFTMTARADHSRTDEQGQQVSTGSAQRSIMFENGYIELMQITDPTKGHQLASAIAVRFGLHIVALGTDDAQACQQQCVARGVAAGPVLNWSRPIHEIDAIGLARFAYFGSAWVAQDPAYVCWVQHLTPELMRTPRLVRHNNHALALSGVCFSGPRSQGTAWRAQLLAAGAIANTANTANTALASITSVVFPNACARIAVQEDAASVLPSALELQFADLAGLRGRCEALHLDMQRVNDNAFSLDLSAQLGLALICRAAA